MHIAQATISSAPGLIFDRTRSSALGWRRSNIIKR